MWRLAVNNKLSAADMSYSTFLESLDPANIALVQSAMSLERMKYLESEREQIYVTFGSKLLRLGDGHFDVKTTLELQVKKEVKSKPLLRFNAAYELHFHAVGATKQNVDRFVKSDVRLLIWPYLRELVSNMTSRMHIPPILLPVGKPGDSSE
jgi:preprotein translocase subunit SecB